MLHQLNVAWIQHTATADVANNLAQISSGLAQLKAAKPDIIVLPEAFAWLQRDHAGQKAIIEPFGEGNIQAQVSRWATEMACYLVAGSMPLLMDGKLYSTLCVFNPQGELETFYRKSHLFSVKTPRGQVYRESCFFEQGPEPVVWHSPWGPIGLAICFDLRFAELFAEYRTQNARLMLLPSAFTRETGQAHWHILVRARAIENQAFMLAVNQAGSHEFGMESYGHSLLISPWGEILHDSGGDTALGYAHIDLQIADQLRSKFLMR